MVSGLHKLDALTRIVEVADFDAMLVFVRTKQSTVELAEKLQARGFAAVALNGDIQQSMREKTVAQLKAGKFDILVATDVAARGLDVERMTHVVNFDVPYDTESYVHRIGRTGRAGRSGEAILFIAPRERNLLRLIERATRQTIEPLSLPSVDDVNTRRLGKFKARIGEALAGESGGVLSQGRAGSGARDRRRPAQRRRGHRLDGRGQRHRCSRAGRKIQPACRRSGRNDRSARSGPSAATKTLRRCRKCRKVGLRSRTTASRSSIASPSATGMARSPAASSAPSPTRRGCTARRSTAWTSAPTTRWCACPRTCRRRCSRDCRRCGSAVRSSICRRAPRRDRAPSRKGHRKGPKHAR